MKSGDTAQNCELHLMPVNCTLKTSVKMFYTNFTIVKKSPKHTNIHTDKTEKEIKENEHLTFQGCNQSDTKKMMTRATFNISKKFFRSANMATLPTREKHPEIK